MQSDNCKRSVTLWGAAVCVALALGIVLSARTAAAAPFAYVASFEGKSVSVIDTATNLLIANVPVGNFPFGVAVTPNGKSVYVTNDGDHNVSVIDTTTNKWWRLFPWALMVRMAWPSHRIGQKSTWRI